RPAVADAVGFGDRIHHSVRHRHRLPRHSRVLPAARVLSGRFNVWHAAVYGVWFLYSVLRASIEVAWFAFRKRAVGAGSVIACDLRTSSDLVLTLIADTASLIPGSIIIDSDRAMGILYLHFLDCDSEEKLLRAKAQ